MSSNDQHSNVLVSKLTNSGMMKLVEQFVAELPDKIAAIEKAAREQNYDVLKEIAYQLKGVAEGYGFPSITKAAWLVEANIKCGEASGFIAQHASDLAQLCRRASVVSTRGGEEEHGGHPKSESVDIKILVVDDDPAVIRLIAKYLSDVGYEVATAQNGRDALQHIYSEGCQLIITDWMMPEMDGLQLCRTIRTSEAAGFVYVLVMTADSDPESLTKAFDAGADDFLAKPVKKQELIARLKAGVRALAAEAEIAIQRRAIHKANAEMATLNDKLKEMATVDELTGLLNRREAMRRLEEYWASVERDGRPFSCVMLDIDHFKQCNDTYGHDFGDAVLRSTALALKRVTRTAETVYRIGGEEFVVLCPGYDTRKAATCAERLRLVVEENVITHGEITKGVTISLGVAEKNSRTTKSEDMLKVADEMLYQAKTQGRNRVCAHRPSENT